jgi:hypothetical protein
MLFNQRRNFTGYLHRQDMSAARENHEFRSKCRCERPARIDRARQIQIAGNDKRGHRNCGSHCRCIRSDGRDHDIHNSLGVSAFAGSGQGSIYQLLVSARRKTGLR